MLLDFQNERLWVFDAKHFAHNFVQSLNGAFIKAKVLSLKHYDFSSGVRIKHFSLHFVNNTNAARRMGQPSNIRGSRIVSPQTSKKGSK